MLSILFLIFLVFFLLHSEEIFHTMYNFFGLTCEKKLYFFCHQNTKKKVLGGIPHILMIKTVWQKFLKLYLCYSNLVAKICLSKYSYSPPLPLTMHNKGFFEKLIKRNKKKILVKNVSETNFKSLW